MPDVYDWVAPDGLPGGSAHVHPGERTYGMCGRLTTYPASHAVRAG